MYPTFPSLVVAVAVAVATADSSTCEGREVCLSGVDEMASDPGNYPQDVVLMQLRTRTSMPKVTWSESDPVLDEDLLEDDQPGVEDLTRPAHVASSNVTEVQVAQVQASLHVHQDPAKSDGSEAPASPPNSEAATDVPTPAPSEGNATAESSAVPAVTSSEAKAAESNGTNSTANTSGNSTNGSANATGEESAMNNSSGCATRADDRIVSWFAAEAQPGSPCVFGVDVRDENSHCIYEDGAYGSFGWCFTNSDRSEWGACNEHCPMYGAPSALGKKIDKVAEKLDKVVQKLSPGNSSDEEEENASPTEAPSAATTPAPSEKGKGKGKS